MQLNDRSSIYNCHTSYNMQLFCSAYCTVYPKISATPEVFCISVIYQKKAYKIYFSLK